MEAIDRAQAVLGLEHAFRDTLKTSVTMLTDDRDEQHQIASAVVAMLVRKLYLEKGEPWLTKVLEMVLQPAEATDPARDS